MEERGKRKDTMEMKERRRIDEGQGG